MPNAQWVYACTKCGVRSHSHIPTSLTRVTPRRLPRCSRRHQQVHAIVSKNSLSGGEGDPPSITPEDLLEYEEAQDLYYDEAPSTFILGDDADAVEDEDPEDPDVWGDVGDGTLDLSDDDEGKDPDAQRRRALQLTSPRHAGRSASGGSTPRLASFVASPTGSVGGGGGDPTDLTSPLKCADPLGITTESVNDIVGRIANGGPRRVLDAGTSTPMRGTSKSVGQPGHTGGHTAAHLAHPGRAFDSPASELNAAGLGSAAKNMILGRMKSMKHRLSRRSTGGGSEQGHRRERTATDGLSVDGNTALFLQKNSTSTRFIQPPSGLSALASPQLDAAVDGKATPAAAAALVGRLLPVSEQFNPRLYISEIHTDASVEALSLGLQHLEQAQLSKQQEQRDLVSAHFDAFVQCRETIGGMSSTLRGNEGGSSSDGGVVAQLQGLQQRFEQVHTRLRDGQGVADALRRRQECKRLRYLSRALRRFRFLYDVPAAIRKAARAGWYTEVVRLYHQGLSQAGGSGAELPPQGQRDVVECIMVQIEASVETVRRDLHAQLTGGERKARLDEVGGGGGGVQSSGGSPDAGVEAADAALRLSHEDERIASILQLLGKGSTVESSSFNSESKQNAGRAAAATQRTVSSSIGDDAVWAPTRAATRVADSVILLVQRHQSCLCADLRASFGMLGAPGEQQCPVELWDVVSDDGTNDGNGMGVAEGGQGQGQGQGGGTSTASDEGFETFGGVPTIEARCAISFSRAFSAAQESLGSICSVMRSGSGQAGEDGTSSPSAASPTNAARRGIAINEAARRDAAEQVLLGVVGAFKEGVHLARHTNSTRRDMVLTGHNILGDRTLRAAISNVSVSARILCPVVAVCCDVQRSAWDMAVFVSGHKGAAVGVEQVEVSQILK